MARLIEKLDGGLVTSNEVSLLRAGELSQTTNWVYEPSSGALITAAGLSAFSAKIPATAATVDGLKACRFSSGTHVLIAACDDATNTVWTSPVGETGTWTARVAKTAQGSGALNVVHYNNKFFLLTGATANRELQSDLSTRRHGLAPVTTAPGIQVSSGTWSVTTDTGVVYYEYWTTEVVKYSDGTELESTVAPSSSLTGAGPPVATATITAPSQVATITRASQVNSDATHWRVYRSVKKETAAQTAWPRGFRISGDIPITVATATKDVTCTKSGTTLTATTGDFSSIGPGYVVSVVSGDWTFAADTLVSLVTSLTQLTLSAAPTGGTGSAVIRFTPTSAADTNSFVDQVITPIADKFGASPVISTGTGWTNTANLFASDGTVATWIGNALPTAAGETVIGNFNLGAIQDPISGLQLKIKWRTLPSILTTQPSARLAVSISTDAGATYGAVLSVPLVVSASTLTEVTVGSTTSGSEFWGVVFNAGVLSGSNFRVKLSAYATSSALSGTFGVLVVDYVSATLGSNVAVGATSDAFPAVFVTVGDQDGLPPGADGVGANGQPPIADIGEVFENALVLNDKSNPSYVRWSLAGQPHYFPSIYFNDFKPPEAGAADFTVTNFKVLNNKGIVGLRDSLWRMNYLPNADDAQFSRGRALDLVSGQYGIFNNQCAVIYQGPEGRPELAFANQYGVFATDGFSVRPLIPDIDFLNLNSSLGARPQPLYLINNPERYELVLGYKVSDETTGTGYQIFELHMNYHPQHIDNGTLKVGGPVQRYGTTTNGAYYGANCATAVPRYDSPNTRTTTVYTGVATVTDDVLYGGQVYKEDYTIITGIAGTAFTPTLITRKMYLAGFGEEWKANELYVVYSNATSPTITVTPKTSKTGAADVNQTARTTGTTTTATRMDKIVFNQIVEGMRWQVAANKAMKLYYLVIDGEDFGTEESGSS